ncbi:hypothetical protein D3C72_2516040 [compost metagenome]
MGPLTDQLSALIEGARQDSGASFSALPKEAPGANKRRFSRKSSAASGKGAAPRKGTGKRPARSKAA